MARKIDPAIEKIITEYGMNPKDVLWDCHGTWCMYHRAIESVAARVGITFDPPQVLEANGVSKSVALCVAGRVAGGRPEWSIGEAAPGNNKNAYPYAMAEKRAKDRVVLKLIGLHGLVYSEDEVDEAPPAKQPPVNSSLDSQAIATDLIRELRQRKSTNDLRLWAESPAVLDEIKKLDEPNAERVRGEYKRLMKEYQEKEKVAA